MLLASLLALLFMLLRLSGGRPGNAVVSSWVSLFRNTPLLVQLLFWYFAAWNGLPQAFRDAVNADHSWVNSARRRLVVYARIFMFCLGVGRLYLAFFNRRGGSGLRSVPAGQREAALAQGFSAWRLFRYILLPQGLATPGSRRGPVP